MSGLKFLPVHLSGTRINPPLIHSFEQNVFVFLSSTKKDNYISFETRYRYYYSSFISVSRNISALVGCIKKLTLCKLLEVYNSTVEGPRKKF